MFLSDRQIGPERKGTACLLSEWWLPGFRLPPPGGTAGPNRAGAPGCSGTSWPEPASVWVGRKTPLCFSDGLKVRFFQGTQLQGMPSKALCLPQTGWVTTSRPRFRWGVGGGRTSLCRSAAVSPLPRLLWLHRVAEETETRELKGCASSHVAQSGGARV